MGIRLARTVSKTPTQLNVGEDLNTEKFLHMIDRSLKWLTTLESNSALSSKYKDLTTGYSENSFKYLQL